VRNCIDHFLTFLEVFWTFLEVLGVGFGGFGGDFWDFLRDRLCFCGFGGVFGGF